MAVALMSALLVALLACSTARVAVAAGCDGVDCGHGNCTDAPGLIPGTTSYECHCLPGWFKLLPFLTTDPCVIPSSCEIVDCGKGGTCRNDDSLLKYHCECSPGHSNILNNTALACTDNCVLGAGCSSPPPSPAPPGSASLQNLLLQLLALLSLAVLQIV